MNFDYSDDQKFLKTEARKFLEARCTPKVVRGVLDNAAVSYDQDLWKAVAEMGWLDASIGGRSRVTTYSKASARTYTYRNYQVGNADPGVADREPQCASGNVRAACLDAESALDAQLCPA